MGQTWYSSLQAWVAALDLELLLLWHRVLDKQGR
jgi:hypothetical protein